MNGNRDTLLQDLLSKQNRKLKHIPYWPSTTTTKIIISGILMVNRSIESFSVELRGLKNSTCAGIGFICIASFSDCLHNWSQKFLAVFWSQRPQINIPHFSILIPLKKRFSRMSHFPKKRIFSIFNITRYVTFYHTF